LDYRSSALSEQYAPQREARTKGFPFVHFLRYVCYNLQSFKQEQKMITNGSGMHETGIIEVFTFARQIS